MFFNHPNFGLILRPKSKNGHISGTAEPISNFFEIWDPLTNAVLWQRFGPKFPTFMDRPPVTLSNNVCQNVSSHHGFENVQFKMAVGASDSNSHMIAHNLGGDHGDGLALGGVDLSGHNRTSGLVLRKWQFTEPTSGSWKIVKLKVKRFEVLASMSHYFR